MAELLEKIKTRWSDSVVDSHASHGDETVVLKREKLVEIMTALKQDSEFDFNVLIDLTVVDGKVLKWKPRFEVVYHLYSINKNHRLRVKVRVEERDAVVPTISKIWPVANWLEREAWDMFGIDFENHPDLRRILMYEEFQGHPLRKDYPYSKRQPLIGPKN